jgi:hypothetical protein
MMWISTRLHGATTQKKTVFILTAVRTLSCNILCEIELYHYVTVQQRNKVTGILKQWHIL